MNQNEERFIVLTSALNQAVSIQTMISAEINTINAQINALQEKIEEEEANDRSTLSPQAQIILDEINCLTCED